MNEKLCDFIRAKIADVEKSVRCRRDAEQTWRGGTYKSWQAVGCYMKKPKRDSVADKEKRILAKNLIELDMFNQVLDELSRS